MLSRRGMRRRRGWISSENETNACTLTRSTPSGFTSISMSKMWEHSGIPLRHPARSIDRTRARSPSQNRPPALRANRLALPVALRRRRPGASADLHLPARSSRSASMDGSTTRPGPRRLDARVRRYRRREAPKPASARAPKCSGTTTTLCRCRAREPGIRHPDRTRFGHLPRQRF